MKGEQIPHDQKMFSIFEQYTEWLSKGKLHKKVELGKNVVIATDQNHFIMYHKVMEHEVDKQLTIRIGDERQKSYSTQDYNYRSISFDRNYYSHNAKEVLSKSFTKVILPKPGKKTQSQKELENSKTFVQLRKRHSAVE